MLFLLVDDAAGEVIAVGCGAGVLVFLLLLLLLFGAVSCGGVLLGLLLMVPWVSFADDAGGCTSWGSSSFLLLFYLAQVVAIPIFPGLFGLSFPPPNCYCPCV